MGNCQSNDSKKNKTRRRVFELLHFNDVYNISPVPPPVGKKEKIEPVDATSKNPIGEPIGGAARFATALKNVQDNCKMNYGTKATVIFSGDFVGPSLESTVTKGGHMIQLLNVLGVLSPFDI